MTDIAFQYLAAHTPVMPTQFGAASALIIVGLVLIGVSAIALHHDSKAGDDTWYE